MILNCFAKIALTLSLLIEKLKTQALPIIFCLVVTVVFCHFIVCPSQSKCFKDEDERIDRNFSFTYEMDRIAVSIHISHYVYMNTTIFFKECDFKDFKKCRTRWTYSDLIKYKEFISYCFKKNGWTVRKDTECENRKFIQYDNLKFRVENGTLRDFAINNHYISIIDFNKLIIIIELLT